MRPKLESVCWARGRRGPVSGTWVTTLRICAKVGGVYYRPNGDWFEGEWRQDRRYGYSAAAGSPVTIGQVVTTDVWEWVPCR
jgi:hypothetical protein